MPITTPWFPVKRSDTRTTPPLPGSAQRAQGGHQTQIVGHVPLGPQSGVGLSAHIALLRAQRSTAYEEPAQRPRQVAGSCSPQSSPPPPPVESALTCNAGPRSLTRQRSRKRPGARRSEPSWRRVRCGVLACARPLMEISCCCSWSRRWRAAENQVGIASSGAASLSDSWEGGVGVKQLLH